MESSLAETQRQADREIEEMRKLAQEQATQHRSGEPHYHHFQEGSWVCCMQDDTCLEAVAFDLLIPYRVSISSCPDSPYFSTRSYESEPATATTLRVTRSTGKP